MELRKILARNVKALRREKGFSQEEFAERAGIDRTYVSHIERCIHAATIDVIGQMALALEVDPEVLVRINKQS